VDNAITAYKTFSRGVFTSLESLPVGSPPVYDPYILERYIESIITNSDVKASDRTPFKDPRPEACKTFVVATYFRAANSAVRLRTYGTELHDPFSGTIREAIRATIAMPSIFPSIIIDDIRYGDGGTGWNNPSEEAIAEVHSIWPGSKIGCLVSLGSGLQGPLQFEVGDGTHDLVGTEELARFCLECVTNCERIHRRISESPERFGLEGKYFRLDVPQGFADIGPTEWEKAGDIAALALDYMNQGTVSLWKKCMSRILVDPFEGSELM
jgi:hypothetical protein